MHVVSSDIGQYRAGVCMENMELYANGRDRGGYFYVIDIPPSGSQSAEDI